MKNRFHQSASVLLLAAIAGGCAAPGGYPTTESRAPEQAAVGAAIGAVAGNVLGYLTDSDRTTTTLLGALAGGGIGYWRGLQADRRLQDAQSASYEISQVQGSQDRYRYEQPKLYARESVAAGGKVATFDKLETPLPDDAVRHHSEDAAAVLKKLGGLAARSDSLVSVYAPTKEARDYMISELRKGAAPTRLAIESAHSSETKVVIGQVPN